MVFLGGAVLANIVSQSQTFFPAQSFPAADENLHTDGRQREHVDHEAGMARARAEDIRKAWTEVVQATQVSVQYFTKSSSRTNPFHPLALINFQFHIHFCIILKP